MTGSMKVSSIGQIAISITDLGKATYFYQKNF
jgi:hypothetical protein